MPPVQGDPIKTVMSPVQSGLALLPLAFRTVSKSNAAYYKHIFKHWHATELQGPLVCKGQNGIEKVYSIIVPLES
eukprot:4522857-Amphidinium_carterae.2